MVGFLSVNVVDEWMKRKVEGEQRPSRPRHASRFFVGQ